MKNFIPKFTVNHHTVMLVHNGLLDENIIGPIVEKLKVDSYIFTDLCESVLTVDEEVRRVLLLN